MKLGTKGRYAVMAMVDLSKFGKESPIPLSEIALRQEISLSYLEQLFRKLREAGLVQSSRGATGGYFLSRLPEEIRISDIVLAADEPLHATRCKPHSGRGCLKRHSRCLVHDLWEQLGDQIYYFLKSITLKDVCDNRLANGPLPPLELNSKGKEPFAP